MGSVIDSIECPNCFGEATNDYYYKSGEEYTYCPNCGYSRKQHFKREKNADGDYLLVTKDGTTNYEIDNLIWEDIEERPLGCYKLKQKNSIAYELGIFSTNEELDMFKKAVQDSIHLFDYCSINTYDGETITQEILIDINSSTQNE